VEIVVKHENHTPIGAFKVRGGIVYFDRLKRERPQVRGIVTATRGNHGQSLAFAGERAGIAVTIVVPHGNSTEKNALGQSGKEVLRIMRQKFPETYFQCSKGYRAAGRCLRGGRGTA
jgi:threonine dehydratase